MNKRTLHVGDLVRYSKEYRTILPGLGLIIEIYEPKYNDYYQDYEFLVHWLGSKKSVYIKEWCIAKELIKVS